MILPPADAYYFSEYSIYIVVKIIFIAICVALFSLLCPWAHLPRQGREEKGALALEPYSKIPWRLVPRGSQIQHQTSNLNRRDSRHRKHRPKFRRRQTTL